MIIKFLGTGTSQGVPVIGCPCRVCNSSDPKDKRLRSSLLITYEDKNYVIDAGPDFRQQMLNTNVKEVEAVFLTHEHNDHVAGLDDLRPLIFRSKQAMKIYGQPRVLNELKIRFHYAFSETPYPGAPKFELVPIQSGDQIELKGLTFRALEVRHGNLPILGYKIGNIAYLTDVKTIPQESLNELEDLELLIISALRKSPEHFSHLVLEETLAFVKVLKPKKTLLMHMSHRIGLHHEIGMDLPANVAFAYDNLEIQLTN